MTLDEAIKHAREVAEKERKSKCNTYDINNCYKCDKYKEISTSKKMTEIICPCGNKTFEYIPSENKNVRVDKNDCLQCAEEHEQLAKWLECLNEIATLYIEHRPFGEYPTIKEEYADETMKILDKYKIKVEGA